MTSLIMDNGVISANYTVNSVCVYNEGYIQVSYLTM
jgi:hypothetical protein